MQPAPPTLSACTKASDTGIPGLKLYPDFVTPEEEDALLAFVDGQPWDSLARRRVQHYGMRFEYADRHVDASASIDQLPPILDSLAQSRMAPLLDNNSENTVLLPTSRGGLDQVTVNEYLAGVGLSPHVDTHSAFGPALLSLSLAGSCCMVFRREGRPDVALGVPPRSLLVMTGEARWAWWV